MAIRNSMMCNFAFTCLNSINISLIYLAAIFVWEQFYNSIILKYIAVISQWEPLYNGKFGSH